MKSTNHFVTICIFHLFSAAMGEDHSEADCFLCVFLTHGDDGVIYGRDGTLPLQVFFDVFRGEHCKSLVGKPKIFLIQVKLWLHCL